VIGYTIAWPAMLLAGLVQAMGTPEPGPVGAQAIAARAISHAHAVRITPFIQYKYSVSLTHRSTTKSYSYDVLERLADHFARFTSLDPNGTPSQEIHLHKTLVSPALFLKVVADEPDPDASPALRVIGRVERLPYTASLVGLEPAGDCANAYHLHLVPVGDPHAHALRDLWVEAGSDRICRANIEMTIDIISRETVTVDVAIDANDFVDRWKFQGKGHTLVGTYALAAAGSFSDITMLADASPSLFR